MPKLSPPVVYRTTGIPPLQPAEFSQEPAGKRGKNQQTHHNQVQVFKNKMLSPRRTFLHPASDLPLKPGTLPYGDSSR